eukprot:GGOE01013942.1.p1 GENE.GGOE01013942.1~~GGOE01013942.1.p1  ORF type:complete len:250 (+),score=15.55 GGOE01013942.1:45-752(+)
MSAAVESPDPAAHGPSGDAICSPRWTEQFAEARTWYHYRCDTLGQSRYLSACAYSAATAAQHRWLLSDQAPEWAFLRCPACGDPFHPRLGLQHPPPWCPGCGATVHSWVPVTEEPLLTITWFRFACTSCGRLSLLGNEPQPRQCIRCHTFSDDHQPFLKAAPSLVPLAIPGWTPQHHWCFPPSHRRLVRTLLLAASRADLPCWMPRDLMILILPFMVPHSSGAPYQCITSDTCSA